jgi:hypothetical protein
LRWEQQLNELSQRIWITSEKRVKLLRLACYEEFPSEASMRRRNLAFVARYSYEEDESAIAIGVV